MTGREKFDEEHQDQDSEPSLKAPGDVAPKGYGASREGDEEDEGQTDETG